ncbi:MAG: hypothetical protein LBC18_10425, partial [Opitutaceae bacterium]|nr:hypothetical protein [Opitutaceae bacterium]
DNTRRDRREHHEANDGGLGETALPKAWPPRNISYGSRRAQSPPRLRRSLWNFGIWDFFGIWDLKFGI